MRSSPLRRAGALCFALLLWLVSGAGSAASSRYVVVVDAGSSGSRLHLFERADDATGVQVRSLFEDKSGDALSAFAGSPAEAGPRGVQPLIDRLVGRLAHLRISPDQVTLHLLATAGMRLVEARSPDTADTIYRSARQALSSSGMKVGRVETLSGGLEGVYAWVDVNHLSGALSREAGTKGPEPLGIIEVGGASAQVTYPSATPASEARHTITLNGRVHQVISLSWLGLGQDQARRAMIDLSRRLSDTAAERCYPDNRAQSGGITAFDADAGQRRISQGRFSFDACSALFDQVIRPFGLPSPTSSRDRPLIQFVGIASVFFALSDWRAADDPATFAQRLRNQCEGEDAYGSKVIPFIRRDPANRFAQNACANGTFIHALLFGPAGLRLEPVQVRAASRIDGQPLSWVRGFALLDH